VGTGVGEGDGDGVVGLGVTGTNVGDGVGATVGGGMEADDVGDGKLDVGKAETDGLGFGVGLAAGEPQPATRIKITSAEIDWRRNMRRPPDRDSSTPQDRHHAPRPHLPAVTNIVAN